MLAATFHANLGDVLMRWLHYAVLTLAVLFSSSALAAAAESTTTHDWPQWLGADRQGVWRESGLFETFPEGGPEIVWRVPVGIGYSGPAVAEGRVFLTDRQQPTADDGQPLRATRQGIPGNERVLCFDAKTGQVLWEHAYDCPYRISYPNGPRATPLVDEGAVYSLGAMGDLICLDAAEGKVQWSKNLLETYDQHAQAWGCAAHPLIDGDLLYCLVGGQGSAVVALDKHTGDEVWKALDSKEVGYSPPMIYELAGRRQLVVWLSEALYGLDPATGEQLWKQEYPTGVPVQRPSVNIVTVRKTGDDMLYVSSFYHGPMMVKVGADGASVVWKGKSNNAARPDGPHCVMGSPVFKDGYGYAVGNKGDLWCFNEATGEQLWQTYDAVAGKKADCGTAFIVPQGDRFVMLNDQGNLIFAELSPAGYRELDRAHILDPVGFARGRDIVWSHPAFADRSVFARNDKEMIRVSLDEEG